MVAFSGWSMPIQYLSILGEARVVRSKVGIFDVSHMGRFSISGVNSESFLNTLLSFDVSLMNVGRARYGLICTEEGGIIDDAVLYRTGVDDFLLVPNASNSENVFTWLQKWADENSDVQIKDVTSTLSMIACQGPHSVETICKLTSNELRTLKFFGIVGIQIKNTNTLVSRTGYTGEDGFEVFVSHTDVSKIWDILVGYGAIPCGLAARDVLRLEAGLLLHGSDMDVEINPYEAGLEKFVNPDRDSYIARDSLTRIRDQGVSKILVGFQMINRGIPRHGYSIFYESNNVGYVTSGTHSPVLDRGIGLGYVPTEFSTIGTKFQIDIRGRFVDAEVVTLPFYSGRGINDST